MSIWRGRGRVWALAWAVIQLAVGPALSVIDGAYAKRDSNVVLAHVEGHSTKSCQPPHSADCAICQFVSALVVRASNTPTLDWPPAPSLAIGQRANAPGPSITLELEHSRAPPTA